MAMIQKWTFKTTAGDSRSPAELFYSLADYEMKMKQHLLD
jgi:hypothetical protein